MGHLPNCSFPLPCPPCPPPQHVDGINLFGMISIVSLVYCAPAAYAMESPMWGAAWQAAITKMGATQFYQILAVGGIFYHLYNQVGSCGGVTRVMVLGLTLLPASQSWSYPLLLF